MNAAKLMKRAMSMQMGTEDKEVRDMWGECCEEVGIERRNSMQSKVIEIATRRMSRLVVDTEGARDTIMRRLSMH